MVFFLFFFYFYLMFIFLFFFFMSVFFVFFFFFFFFFSSRRRHTRFDCDWSSDVCSSDLTEQASVVNDRARFTVGVGSDLTNAVIVTLVATCPTDASVQTIPVEEIGRASCRERV